MSVSPAQPFRSQFVLVTWLAAVALAAGPGGCGGGGDAGPPGGGGGVGGRGDGVDAGAGGVATTGSGGAGGTGGTGGGASSGTGGGASAGSGGRAAGATGGSTGGGSGGRTGGGTGGMAPPAGSGGLSGAGGGGGGRAGTGGSGPNDVTATINVAQRRQTLAGFGAAVAYYTNWLAPRTDNIFTVLFPDLGLDILRLGNWYQNQAATGTSASTAFSDTDGVTIVQKATAALGRAPRILMSSWSPPSYLKSNAATKGTRGTLIQTGGAYQYSQFADWWVRSLAAYAQRGVVPDYISIQNEPDFFDAGWETCLFGATESATSAGYGAALAAVYNAVQASAMVARKPQILGPETTGIGTTVVQRYLAEMNPAHIAGVAHHLYNGGGSGTSPAPDSFAAAMTGVATAASAIGKATFMTEYSAPAHTMLDTAWLIHNALTTEGVAAYIYWDLIWAPPAAGAAPVSLVTIQGAATQSAYTINDLYYAVKHFSRWTDPGWVRVDASSTAAAVKVSAFVSSDGRSLTVVLINTDGSAHRVGVSPGGFAFGAATGYRSAGAAERTAAAPLGAGNSLMLPARSIATVVFTP